MRGALSAWIPWGEKWLLASRQSSAFAGHHDQRLPTSPRLGQVATVHGRRCGASGRENRLPTVPLVALETAKHVG